MKFLKVLLAILCIAIAVLCVLLVNELGGMPVLSQCASETASKLTATAPEMPEMVGGETASTTVQTTVSTTAETKGSTAAVHVMTEEESRICTENMVNSLAINAGEAYAEANELLTELKSCSEQKYYLLLSEILGNSYESLDDMAELCGMDQKTVKQAAVSCWATKQQDSSKAVFSFVGDCTFAYYNEQNRKRGFPMLYEKSGSITYPLDSVRGVFSADDITTVNFEGTLTDSTSHAEKQFYFRGETEYAKILSGSSVEGANLANNHTLDYYELGFEDTVKALESEEISTFWASEPYVSSLRTESGTVSVVMLSASSIGIKNQNKFIALKAQIKRYKSPNTIVIANVHWGTESAVKPSDWQIETAHELVDAGADLIVGHHPHVLQGIEKYNGAYIAYSLGNFSFGGNSRANYPETAILRAVFDIDSGEVGDCSISAVPCYTTSSGSNVNDYKPSLQYGKKGQDVIDLILERSAMLENGITELYWHGIK